MQANNILIIGNYGAGNLGDDAIFAGIVSELAEIGYKGKISLLHSGFASSLDIYEGFDKFPLVPSGFRSFLRKNLDTFEAIKKADLIILGGGGLFVDSESMKAPFIWYKQAMACKSLKTPYICYSQSIGPLNSFISRFFTNKVLKNAKAVHFRDKNEHTDSALFWAAKNKKTEVKDNTFLLSLRKWDKKTDASWEEIIKNCKNYANEHKLTLKLLPMDLRDGSELNALKNTGLELLQPKSATDLLKIISKANILCSMRLHPSILALAVGTPVVSISYSRKVQSFIENMNVKTGAIVLDINETGKIKNSLEEISGKSPQFDIKTPTKKNQEFLARELHL